MKVMTNSNALIILILVMMSIVVLLLLLLIIMIMIMIIVIVALTRQQGPQLRQPCGSGLRPPSVGGLAIVVYSNKDTIKVVYYYIM